MVRRGRRPSAVMFVPFHEVSIVTFTSARLESRLKPHWGCGDGQGHPAPAEPRDWHCALAGPALSSSQPLWPVLEGEVLPLSEPTRTTPLHHSGNAGEQSSLWMSNSPRELIKDTTPPAAGDGPRQSPGWHRAGDSRGSPSRGGRCRSLSALAVLGLWGLPGGKPGGQGCPWQLEWQLG